MNGLGFLWLMGKPHKSGNESWLIVEVAASSAIISVMGLGLALVCCVG